MSHQCGVIVYKTDGTMAVDTVKVNDFNGDMTKIVESVAANQEKELSDYSWKIYTESDGNDYTRLMNGDDYTAILDGQGNINSLDFSIEDNRKIIKLSTNVEGNRIRALPDGTYEPINIIVQAYENDGVTINNDYNGTVEVLVLNPSWKKVYVEATLINGRLETAFVPRHMGVYTIQQVVKNGAKIGNKLEINVYHKAVSI